MKLRIQKTSVLKPADVKRNWYIVDASGVALGLLAVEVAKLLSGSTKADFTPHVDSGDFVIVTNASKVAVSGAKALQKKYYRHSGYVGNLKEATFSELIVKNPERIISEAVKGMLAKNKLQSEKLKRLRVFSDENHDHSAQKPTEIKIGGK